MKIWINRIKKWLPKVALAGGVAALMGCANTPVATSLTPAQKAQDLANQQTQQYQECLLYHAAQPTIAKKVATLPLAQATSVLDASVQATTYCNTALSNTQSESDALTKALTTITMETGINFAAQGTMK